MNVFGGFVITVLSITLDLREHRNNSNIKLKVLGLNLFRYSMLRLFRCTVINSRPLYNVYSPL